MEFLAKILQLSRAQQLLLIQWTLVLQFYDKFQIKDFISRYDSNRIAYFRVLKFTSTFQNDPRKGESGRSEDDIIAWTWKHFLLYPNQPDWLLRLPMTKAARLAMDTINSKIQEERKKNRQWEEQFAPVIDEFTIMGASKRGWTTWTIAAVDKRVKDRVFQFH